MWRMTEKYDGKCEKCCDMLDGEISKSFYILREVAQGCTLSHKLFKMYTNDMISSSRRSKSGSHGRGGYSVRD